MGPGPELAVKSNELTPGFFSNQDPVVNSVNVKSGLIYRSSSAWSSTSPPWYLEYGFQLQASVSNLTANDGRVVWSSTNNLAIGNNTYAVSGDGTTFNYTSWIPRYLFILKNGTTTELLPGPIPLVSMNVLTDSNGNVVGGSISRTGASGIYAVGNEPLITVSASNAPSVPFSIITKKYNLIYNTDGTYTQGATLLSSTTAGYTLNTSGT